MSENDEDALPGFILEAEAQIEILRALRPLDPESRIRVIEAMGYLLKADEQIPGILDMISKSLPTPREK